MNGYLVHSDYWHGYLAFVPYDGSVTWPGGMEHAHVLSLDDATAMVDTLPCAWKLRLLGDRRRREPQPIPAKAEIELLALGGTADAVARCLTHQAEPVTRVEVCSEPVPNYDAPTKAERDSVERDVMAYIQRVLK